MHHIRLAYRVDARGFDLVFTAQRVNPSLSPYKIQRKRAYCRHKGWFPLRNVVVAVGKREYSRHCYITISLEKDRSPDDHAGDFRSASLTSVPLPSETFHIHTGCASVVRHTRCNNNNKPATCACVREFVLHSSKEAVVLAADPSRHLISSVVFDNTTFLR